MPYMIDYMFSKTSHLFSFATNFMFIYFWYALSPLPGNRPQERKHLHFGIKERVLNIKAQVKLDIGILGYTNKLF